MTETCGDDLIAARRFMDLCQSHMSEIFSGGEIPMADVVTHLDEIQSRAKLMKARSIYKSAETVIKDLTKRRSVTACASSVLVLQKLIRQYETGLSEIAPVSRPLSERPVVDLPFGPELVSELTRQKTAAEILTPLVKFADPDNHPSLLKLVSMAANQSRAGKTVSETLSETPSESERLDMMMPSITNHWLRLSRTQNKSISVSTALDEAFIKVSRLKALQGQVKFLGETLVAQSVERPDVRAEKDLNRSAHIAVTGRISGKTYEFSISCEGLEPAQSSIAIINDALRKAGMQTYSNYQSGRFKFDITGISVEPLTPDVAKEVAS